MRKFLSVTKYTVDEGMSSARIPHAAFIDSNPTATTRGKLFPGEHALFNTTKRLC